MMIASDRLNTAGTAALGLLSPRMGKLLVTSSGYQGMTLWDVQTGRAKGQMINPSNSEGIAAAFTHGYVSRQTLPVWISLCEDRYDTLVILLGDERHASCHEFGHSGLVPSRPS
jgi:hypothetical protein